jgi:hypothetical protein
MYLLTHSHQKNYMTIFNTFTKLILIAALLLNGIAFGVSSDAQFNTDLMFKRKGTNQCFDSSTNSNGGRLETVDCVPTNPNQRFQKQDVGNGYFLIKVRNMCLNAYNPRNGSVLNMWSCNTSDNDMKWRMVGGQSNVIQRFGTNYCINANLPVNGKAPNIWTCDDNDGDQKWDIYTPNTNTSPAPVDAWKYDYYIISRNGPLFTPGHVFTGIAKAKVGTNAWTRVKTQGFWPNGNLIENKSNDIDDFDRVITGQNPIGHERRNWDYRKINVTEARGNWIMSQRTDNGSSFGPSCNFYVATGTPQWAGANGCSCVDFATRQWRKATNGKENWTPSYLQRVWPWQITDILKGTTDYFDNGNIQT